MDRFRVSQRAGTRGKHLQKGQDKGGGFARTGFCRSPQVAAAQSRRNDRYLHWCWHLIALGADGANQGITKTDGSKLGRRRSRSHAEGAAGSTVSSEIGPRAPLRNSFSSVVAARARSSPPAFFARLRVWAMTVSSPWPSKLDACGPNRFVSRAG